MTSNVSSGLKLFVSNKYRNSKQELPFDFYIPDFSTALGYTQHYMLCLKSCEFTNHFNTVSEGKNDLFVFMVNGTTYQNTIESGYYDIYTFMDALNAALTNAAVENSLTGLSVSYDSVELKLVWTIPDGCTFSLSRSNNQSERSAIPYNSYLYPNAQDRFLELCGAVENADTAFVGPTTFVSSAVVNLYGTRLLHINLGTELGVLTPAYTHAQTIASVPVTAERGGVNSWTNPFLVGHPITGESLQHLRIYCHDEWEQVVDDVPANTLFHLTFLLLPTNQ
jgi:hypothetical protein